MPHDIVITAADPRAASSPTDSAKILCGVFCCWRRASFRPPTLTDWGGSAYDWGYQSVPGRLGYSIAVQSGKVLGGESAINAAVAKRAPASDFAKWKRHACWLGVRENPSILQGTGEHADRVGGLAWMFGTDPGSSTFTRRCVRVTGRPVEWVR